MKICDSVLYTYISKVADTAEKRRCLDLSCAVACGSDSIDLVLNLEELGMFGILDLDLSIFQPYDLCLLLGTIGWNFSHLWRYFMNFRSNPERSKEFYYQSGPWNALVATRYMRSFRTPSNSR